MNTSVPLRLLRVSRPPRRAATAPSLGSVGPIGTAGALRPWWERLLPWVPDGGTAPRPPGSFYS